MKRIVRSFVISFSLAATSACHLAGKATVYTEEGVRLAAEQWDADYNEQLEFCAEKFPAATPEAESCFGPWFDADGKVEVAVKSVVALLRAYWLERASGRNPDWRKVAVRVFDILEDLPPQARSYFDRVRGL